MSEAGPSGSAGSAPQYVGRRVRLHKVAKPLDEDGSSSALAMRTHSDGDYSRHMDRRIAEILPTLADLPLAGTSGSGEALAESRRLRSAKLEIAEAEARELADLFDMSIPHPLDNAPPALPWTGAPRPVPRKVVLSPYQYEMINYQRMLLRKNIWYYRDRMNVPRGPCPLHVLKEAWVGGIVDENTLMWGHGLFDWLPAKNIKLLLPLVRTPEVRFATWVKRTFSLKPSLNRIREQRKEYRDPAAQSQQVELMR